MAGVNIGGSTGRAYFRPRPEGFEAKDITVEDCTFVGSGAAFVGSLATFLSLPLAAAISARINGTVTPLIAGFAVLGLAACCVMYWTNRGRPD